MTLEDSRVRGAHKKGKKVWQSKTIWLNGIVFLCGLIPTTSSLIKEHSVNVTLGVAALNLLLRLITKHTINPE